MLNIFDLSDHLVLAFEAALRGRVAAAKAALPDGARVVLEEAVVRLPGGILTKGKGSERKASDRVDPWLIIHFMNEGLSLEEAISRGETESGGAELSKVMRMRANALAKVAYRVSKVAGSVKVSFLI